MKTQSNKSLTEATYTTSFIEGAGHIVEQVWSPEKGSKFAVYTYACAPGTQPNVHYEQSIELNEKSYSPIILGDLAGRAILLPSEASEYGDETTLLQDIQTHMRRYLEIPEDMIVFSSYYILLSWLYDKFNTICYLRALGDTGSGKSRFLDVIGRLCYKPILANGAATSAPVFRLINEWKGTLIIDEADLKDSDTTNDLIKIINCGFEKGRYVLRCNNDDGNAVEAFEVYGPKILASRYTFKDKATESRCLTTVMRQTNRTDIPVVLTTKFFESEQKLRNKLLMYRFKNYLNVGHDEEGTINLELEPRLQQATYALSLLFKGIPSIEAPFKLFIQTYQTELINERSESDTGIIVNSLIAVIERGITVTPSVVLDECLKRGFETNTRTIGRILKSIGITTKLKRHGLEVIREILPTEDTLKLLKTRYVVRVDSSEEKGAKIPPKKVTAEATKEDTSEEKCNVVTSVTKHMGRGGSDVTEGVTDKSGVPHINVTNVTTLQQPQSPNPDGLNSPSYNGAIRQSNVGNICNNTIGVKRPLVTSVTSVTSVLATLDFLRSKESHKTVGFDENYLAKGGHILPENVTEIIRLLIHDGYLLELDGVYVFKDN